ncbi:MAG: hypothetical protein LWX55_14835 [Deltaproteobacteria bacterium]|nr:hypothetical protein [Deltaproteobacteria bacterium]
MQHHAFRGIKKYNDRINALDAEGIFPSPIFFISSGVLRLKIIEIIKSTAIANKLPKSKIRIVEAITFQSMPNFFN